MLMIFDAKTGRILSSPLLQRIQYVQCNRIWFILVAFISWQNFSNSCLYILWLWKFNWKRKTTHTVLGAFFLAVYASFDHLSNICIDWKTRRGLNWMPGFHKATEQFNWRSIAKVTTDHVLSTEVQNVEDTTEMSKYHLISERSDSITSILTTTKMRI